MSTTNDDILYVKEHVSELNNLDFIGAISSFSNVDMLLTSLLKAIGFSEILKESKGSISSYYALERSLRVDLVVYDSSTFTLLGSATSDLVKAYDLVKAIEGELSDAMCYPPVLRKKIIDAVIADAGVDEDFYKAVLSHWKAYR